MSTQPIPNSTWHPYVTHDALATRTSANTAKWGWQILATATVVAFCALAVFLTVSTAIESMALTGTLVLLVGLPFSYKIFKIFWDKATVRADEVKFNDHLLGVQNSLPLYPRQQVKDLGIKTETLTDQDLQKLRPVIARAKVHIQAAETGLKEAHDRDAQSEIELLIDKKELKVNVKQGENFDAIDPIKPETLEIYETLANRRIEILNTIQTSLLDRIHAAYCLHVIQNPHDLTPKNKFFQLNFVDYDTRLKVKALGHGNSEHFLTATHSNEKFTVAELEALTTQQVAQKVFKLS